MAICWYASIERGARGPMAAIVLWWATVAVQAAPKPFGPGSLEDILGARSGSPFVLALWSLDCGPCRRELVLLSRTLRQDPGFDLVLVATDDPSRGAELDAVLDGYGLSAAESWVFAHPHVQRLRYEIDPGWYGELPRSYLYDPDHRRQTVSGAIEAGVLGNWLEAIRRQRQVPESLY